MLKRGSYVRCPADIESTEDPRSFACGQVVGHDPYAMTVAVMFHDPFKLRAFYADLPEGIIVYPEASVQRCRLFTGSKVVWNDKCCTVLSCKRIEEDLLHYYLQDDNLNIALVCECDIVASLTNGEVSPTAQLKDFEFQNPCWYFGRSVVSRCMNTLDNSVQGFKELAGSKILLLPHQVNTIMRCLQDEPFRYMLADEVGMGKTVEAASIIKIYLSTHANSDVLIVIPDMLEEQWKTELLVKFDIQIGKNENGNIVQLSTFSSKDKRRWDIKWDLVIVDEVHKSLKDRSLYDRLQTISRASKNLLLLSATPVQQRRDEYLDLLRLLHPEKYCSIDTDRFSELISRQSNVIQRASLVLDNLDDFEETIAQARKQKIDPHKSEDCEDLFEEVHEGLSKIAKTLGDEKLFSLIKSIDFTSKSLSVKEIKVVLSYICSNYQLESNIIRNRRKILEGDDDRLLPTRLLKPLPYPLDPDLNAQEASCYKKLCAWIEGAGAQEDFESTVKPLVGSFFSSSWAFASQVQKLLDRGVSFDADLIKGARRWVKWEEKVIENLPTIMLDPSAFEDKAATRIFTVVDFIDQYVIRQKVVLFTNFPETFTAYKKALELAFGRIAVGFFGASIPKDEAERDAYRFQNDKSCRILLCDQTGGEGRNFQCADYVVHIDLPWDANAIEQRIGRLDRLERDPSRPDVNSVVPYAEDSFEEALFRFWNEGLRIFTESLSGMEIIMGDVNDGITAAISKDFRTGLFEMIPEIIKKADEMREAVRKEQNFDAAGLTYRPLYTELRRLIDYHTDHEDELFAAAMTSWASLAGFKGSKHDDGTIVYSGSSFSPASAVASRLIPPKWSDYMSSARTSMESVAQRLGEGVGDGTQSIRGTFIRKVAIGGDYLHFFAPGDGVFDCIVENAMQSCKGRACAFAARSRFEWKGLIFTWSFQLDSNYLLDNDISPYALGTYRISVPAEQVVIPYSLENPDDLSDGRILGAINEHIAKGFQSKKYIHLGKRSYQASHLKEVPDGSSNIDWFKSEYPPQVWEEIVDSAEGETKRRAEKWFSKSLSRSLDAIQKEMERVLSAKIASDKFYEQGDEGADLEKKQCIIYEAISRSNPSLDSACFVWLFRD